MPERNLPKYEYPEMVESEKVAKSLRDWLDGPRVGKWTVIRNGEIIEGPKSF